LWAGRISWSFAQAAGPTNRVALLAQLQAFARLHETWRVGPSTATCWRDRSPSPADLHLLETNHHYARSRRSSLDTLPDFGIRLLPGPIRRAPARCFFARELTRKSKSCWRAFLFTPRPSRRIASSPEPRLLRPTVPSYDATALDAFEIDSEEEPRRIGALLQGPAFNLTPEGGPCSSSRTFRPASADWPASSAISGARRLRHVRSFRRSRGERRWSGTRHGLKAFRRPAAGLCLFRQRPTLNDLKRYINGPVDIANLEVVCEDVVLPVPRARLKFPIPSHGTFGVRSVAQKRATFFACWNFQPILNPFSSVEETGSRFRSGGLLLSRPAHPPKVQLEAALLWETDRWKRPSGFEAHGRRLSSRFRPSASSSTTNQRPLDLFTIAGLHHSRSRGAKLGIGAGPSRRWPSRSRTSYEVGSSDLVGQNRSRVDPFWRTTTRSFQLQVTRRR